jgi:ABC-type sugar transport system ATPase subunit/ribose/xylose/arabinose/galactoside ABC-type transport system permease subunit
VTVGPEAKEAGVSSAAGTAVPALACRGLVKRFPGVLALDDVDIEVSRGEIHALVGENGAGKSTLVKILTGVYQPDEGEILVAGEAVPLANPSDAADRGIAIVHQDSPLVAQFDVTRNAFLGREIVGIGGVLNLKAMRADTAEALERVGATFGPDTLVRELTVGQREQVSIAAALVQKPSVLILDEPTASLGADDVERLFDIIRALKESGVTIIYISHHLDEVFRLASRITVLRDGRRAGTLEIGAVDRPEIIRLMIGRDLSQLYPKEELDIGEPVLTVDDLHQGTAVRGVALNVRKGEILGLAGLVGAGRTETALTLFGALRRSGGEVTLAGKSIDPKSPNEAKRLGLALIPEDRRTEGLITDLSVRENLTLASLGRWSNLGIIRRGVETAGALGLVDALQIMTPGLGQRTRNLSGGNQQKVVIGRWFATQAQVYIFDEPTTGVDVGSKVEIYNLMTEVARLGAAVIFISSDFEELLGMCDRIAVMKKGRVVAEFPRSEAGLQELLHAATSGEDVTSAGVSGGHVGGATLPGGLLPAEPGTETAGEMAPPMIETALEVAEESPPGGERDSKPRTRSDVLAFLGRFLGRWGAIMGMAIAILIVGIGAPRFWDPDNLFVILKQGSILALIALALTVVLIAGGFDMSVGAVSQLTANLSAGTILAGFGTIAALSVGLAVGLVFGIVNAILVVFVAMPPFVATLGVMFIAIGLSFAYNGGQALTLYEEPTFFFLGQGEVGPIPFVFVVLVALTALLHFILKRTRMGLRMYAAGENPAAAQMRGVSRRRALIIASIAGGLIAGFSGTVLASYSYGASALATGLDFLISALAAAFLGSVLSKTGELDVRGTAVAAMFITALNTGLILNGTSNLLLPGIQGAILIISVLFGVIRRREIGQVLIF